MTGELGVWFDGSFYRMAREERPDRLYHVNLPFGHSTQRHVHPSYHLILVKGGCSLHITGFTPVACPEHALVMINPNVEHHFVYDQVPLCIHYPLIWQLQDSEGKKLTCPLQTIIGLHDNAHPYFMRVLNRIEAERFLQQHRELERFSSNSSPYLISAKYLALMILGVDLLWRGHWRGEEKLTTRQRTLVDKINSIIELYFGLDYVTPEHIARELDRNLRYLNLTYRQETGIGIGAALRARRMAHARGLLEMTNCPVKQVMLYCGFRSQSYFCSVFRRENGISPQEYRRLHGGAVEYPNWVVEACKKINLDHDSAQSRTLHNHNQAES